MRCGRPRSRRNRSECAISGRSGRGGLSRLLSVKKRARTAPKGCMRRFLVPSAEAKRPTPHVRPAAFSGPDVAFCSEGDSREARPSGKVFGGAADSGGLGRLGVSIGETRPPGAVAHESSLAAARWCWGTTGRPRGLGTASTPHLRVADSAAVLAHGVGRLVLTHFRVPAMPSQVAAQLLRHARPLAFRRVYDGGGSPSTPRAELPVLERA
jgi:hypothetical protein